MCNCVHQTPVPEPNHGPRLASCIAVRTVTKLPRLLHTVELRSQGCFHTETRAARQANKLQKTKTWLQASLTE